MGGSGDAPEKTAEQIAMENRQRRQLNEEIAGSERRLKATARGKLGKQSLLSQPMQPAAKSTGPLTTKGYVSVDGALKKTSIRNRGAQLKQGKMGAAAGGVAGADKNSMIGGVVGGTASKKKKLFGGVF